MLVEIAIGDAYGAAFEYATEMIAAHNDGRHYSKHPRHDILPGCYTDDTQMSIAIAEALVSGEPWMPENLADRFVAVFKRNPRNGYSRHFYDLLQQVTTGQELLERIEPASRKSGAAMRAGPIGVLPSPDEVIARATVQARITHDTPEAIAAAQAAALMTHYFMYDRGPKAELFAFVKHYVPTGLTVPWIRKVGSQGLMSVSAAITAVMRNDCATDLLMDCVAFTGDTDTVCAIGMAAASCSREYTFDLPENMYVLLEQGRDEFGLRFLRDLDAALMNMSSR